MLGLLCGKREKHCAVQQIWSEGLAVERPLNAPESVAHVAHVELIPDEDFGSGLTKSIGAVIIAVKECADGIAPFKELIDSWSSGMAAGGCDENPGLLHFDDPFLDQFLRWTDRLRFSARYTVVRFVRWRPAMSS